MLEREDWEEQCCSLRKPQPVLHIDEDCVQIPARQVVEELDQFLETNDVEGAEAHLTEWLKKAREGRLKPGS